MHIKNTIPAEFVFNSALMKNIENTLMKQHSTINNERMITEIQHRLQTESNEILSDLYLQALDMLYSKKTSSLSDPTAPTAGTALLCRHAWVFIC
ncbi:conserved hypothetical protein [Klebsiella variicola]|nr:conserved hypothetical protein [Klebsiella variicola]